MNGGKEERKLKFLYMQKGSILVVGICYAIDRSFRLMNRPDSRLGLPGSLQYLANIFAAITFMLQFTCCGISIFMDSDRLERN